MLISIIVIHAGNRWNLTVGQWGQRDETLRRTQHFRQTLHQVISGRMYLHHRTRVVGICCLVFINGGVIMNQYQVTVYCEIPVKISFSIDKGQKGSWDQPEYKPSIEDMTFDDKQVIEAVNNKVYGKNSTVIEELWEDVRESRDSIDDLPF